MANAFYIYNPKTKSPQVRNDKIIPDPIVLGDTEVIVDGKKELVTATNGQLLYPLVKPNDYPTTSAGRERRRGAVRK